MRDQEPGIAFETIEEARLWITAQEARIAADLVGDTQAAAQASEVMEMLAPTGGPGPGATDDQPRFRVGDLVICPEYPGELGRRPGRVVQLVARGRTVDGWAFLYSAAWEDGTTVLVLEDYLHDFSAWERIWG